MEACSGTPDPVPVPMTRSSAYSMLGTRRFGELEDNLELLHSGGMAPLSSTCQWTTKVRKKVE